MITSRVLKFLSKSQENKKKVIKSDDNTSSEKRSVIGRDVRVLYYSFYLHAVSTTSRNYK